MPTYTAPLDDIRFVLFDLLKAETLAELPGFADATQDVVEAVLEEAGKFSANELQPINHSGDEEGCRYENGTVTTPKGFKEAYAKFIEGGWTGPAVRSGIRRAGPAEGDQFRGRGDDLLRQSLLRHVSGPFQRRLQRARLAWHGRAEGDLSAEAGCRHLVRHHVPDRAAVRHRSRPHQDQGRAGPGRQLQDHRHQDLHLRRRA